MKELIHFYNTKIIERQILHDVLFKPELWIKIYKILDENDFPAYHKTFNILCDIYKEKRKISTAYLFDKTGSITEFLEPPIHSTNVFFEDFMEILRDRRIKEKMKKLTESKKTSREINKEIIELEKLRLTAFEIKTFSQSFDEYYQKYCERKNNVEQGNNLILKTNFNQFDSKIGLTRGELITLAARTGIGKSAFSLNLALQTASQGKNVLFISVEMSEDQMFERILSYETGMNSEIFKFAKYDNDNFGKLADKVNKKYKTLKILYLPQATSLTIDSLARKAKKTDLLIVDYLQILKDPMNKNETNATRVGEITGRFKRLAGELNCAIICVSQVNREASRGLNKEPEIHQLRDSGSIEQDSDKVLFLNRDKDNSPLYAILYVAKNRSGKEGSRLNYYVDMANMQFKEINK